MREFVVIYCCKLPRVSPIHLEKIVSIFTVHMLALAGIEIVVGLTMIGTFLAIVVLIIGDSKEQKPTEEPVDSSDEDKDVEKAEPGIAKKVEKPKEAKDAPKEPEKETNEPVMAILQKPDSGDKSALHKMPNVGKRLDLPPLPGVSKPTHGEELERQIVEKRLQRIADKQAKQKKDEPGELPAFPTPPRVGGEKSALPPIPKPFLHELPQPGGEKPALPPLPKQGGDLPSIPGSASEQDEADLQTRDKDRDS